VTLDELSDQQWAKIMSLLQTEMNVGPTGPGSGTNPAGRLQGLYDLRKSIDPWTGLFPWCGVQLVDVSERDYASRLHLVTSTFHIVIGTKSDAKSAVTNGFPQPNLDDAMAQLQALRSDGRGNGVASVLRDKTNYGLGGLALKTWISGIKYDWEIVAGDDTEALAYCIVSYNAQQTVSI